MSNDSINQNIKPQRWGADPCKARIQERRPPIILSKIQLKFYDKAIKEALKHTTKQNQTKIPKRALVLGATPELRDMAIENGFECYAVDISKNSLEIFSSVMKHKNDPKNIEVNKDWREMEYPDGFFGIIMGDVAFENLCSLEDYEKVLAKVSKMLAKKGLVLYRSIFVLKGFQQYPSTEKVIEDIRNKKLDIIDAFCEFRIWVYIDKVYNPKTKVFEVRKCLNLFKEDFEKGLMTREEYESIKKLWHDYDKNIFMDKKEFIDLLAEHSLNYKKEIIDTDYRLGYYAIPMVFEKK